MQKKGYAKIQGLNSKDEKVISLFKYAIKRNLLGYIGP